MSDSDEACDKALKAIRELYVEIHELQLNAKLLGLLYQVCTCSSYF